MMGQKDRSFAALPPVTLDDLVPPDHFYCHLERALDLSFVRDLVRDAYADIGRPSIDPVVFFKLQLIMFFEGIRSERQLMRVVGDRLSLRSLSGLRPDRTAARPLQSDAHPGALWIDGLPPLLRDGRRTVPGHRTRVGPGVVYRRDQGRGQCITQFAPTAVCRRGAFGLSLHADRERARG